MTQDERYAAPPGAVPTRKSNQPLIMRSIKEPRDAMR